MINQIQILGEILAAMILGGVIGFEREAADKPAGFRTHMLVAGAACLLTSIGKLIVPQEGIDQELISADPIRIIEAVITGVSFLGAGTIIRQRGKNQVEGITTAASLLLVSALGIAIAIEQFLLTIGTTILLLITLRGAKYAEKYLTRLGQS